MAKGLVELVIKAVDEASGTLSGIGGKIEGMSAQLKQAGIAMGVAGAAITGALALSLKAAAAEEAGIQKLSVSLKNVGINYDDVKKSLEGTIAATQKKTAVADDAQRESLSFLVAITKDLSKALELNTIAMDLARWKGIDLSTAADIIGKVYSGNMGTLSRYGIVLKEGATATEALAQIQAMAGGQAEAYGKTMAGQMSLIRANLGDLQESIGSILSTALLPLVEKINNVITRMKEWTEAHPQLTKMIILTAAVLGPLLTLVGGFLVLLPSLVQGVILLAGAWNLLQSSWLGPVAFAVALAGMTAIGVLAVKMSSDIKKSTEEAMSPKLTPEMESRALGTGAGVGAAFAKGLADAAIPAINAVTKLETAVFPGGWSPEMKALYPNLTAFYEKYQDIYGKLPGGSYGVGTSFQMGGIVTRPTLGLLGERGAEAVIPLDNLGGGGVMINFTEPVFFEREEMINSFATKIYDKVKQLQRLNFGAAYSGSGGQ